MKGLDWIGWDGMVSLDEVNQVEVKSWDHQSRSD